MSTLNQKTKIPLRPYYTTYVLTLRKVVSGPLELAKNRGGESLKIFRIWTFLGFILLDIDQIPKKLSNGPVD